MERVDLKKRLDKMEEKRVKKIQKDEEEEDNNSGDDDDRVKEKKAKNMAKMLKYHQRKRREFKQREPVVK